MLNRHETLAQLDAIIEAITIKPLKRELQAVAHKVRFPMTSILAKVYGDTLTEKAKRIGVSRQTMYVWAAERFRPTPAQAARISKLTGVPIVQIVDDGFDPERPHHAKAAKLARKSLPASAGDGRTPRRGRRMVRPQARS